MFYGAPIFDIHCMCSLDVNVGHSLSRCFGRRSLSSVVRVICDMTHRNAQYQSSVICTLVNIKQDKVPPSVENIAAASNDTPEAQSTEGDLHKRMVSSKAVEVSTAYRSGALLVSSPLDTSKISRRTL